jgi:hypothetical protein
MAKNKKEQPADVDYKLQVYVEEFKKQYVDLRRKVQSLGELYVKAKKDYQDFGSVLRASGLEVSDQFLYCLERIGLGEMYPSMLFQMRGFLRLLKMSYDDQFQIIEQGIPVWSQVAHQAVTRKLTQMTDAEILQCVTVSGRLLSVEEQRAHATAMTRKERRQAETLKRNAELRARKVARDVDHIVHYEGYVMSPSGIRFSDYEKVWKYEELKAVLDKYVQTYGTGAGR